LNGSASKDPDGSIVAYQWLQTSGQNCTLSGAKTVQASFTAPSVTSSTTLDFKLTVTDNKGLSASDTCRITVLPAGQTDTTSSSSQASSEETPSTVTGSTGGNKIWLEAEDGNIDAPIQIDEDTNASTASFIWVPPGMGTYKTPTSKAGTATYTFTVASTGTYRIWARVLAPTAGDNSFFVSMDGGDFQRWDTAVSTSWTWDLVNVNSGADPKLFQLASGTHTLILMQREDGTKIDKLIITNNDAFVP
jgi:hypothetical protein